MPTALVDLSAVCRTDDTVAWDRYLLVREQLRATGFEVAAIAEDAVRLALAPVDRSYLEAAVRRGEVEVVPYAAPHLVRRALADRDAVLVSDDRFLPLRGAFPALDGFDRLLTFTVDGHHVELHHGRLAPVTVADVDAATDAEVLVPLGYRSFEDRELLRWDWRCSTRGCTQAALPQLDALPACDQGAAACPACGRLLVRLGPVEHGVEFALHVDGQVRQRVAVAVGLSLTVGRGAAAGDVDVQHLLADDAAALEVAREHLVVSNRDGRLRVRDAGSHPGSLLLRADGERRILEPGETLVVDPTDRVCLGGVLVVQLCERRWSRAGLLPWRDAPIASAS